MRYDSLLRLLDGQRAFVAHAGRYWVEDTGDAVYLPGAWTLRQHLQHVSEAEVRYVVGLEGLLRDGTATVVEVNAPEPPVGATLASLADAFCEARGRFIDRLAELGPDDWERRGTEPSFWGEVTVEWWAERAIQHAAEHISETWFIRKLAGVSTDTIARLRDLDE
jgi:hypothetical protein